MSKKIEEIAGGLDLVIQNNEKIIKQMEEINQGYTSFDTELNKSAKKIIDSQKKLSGANETERKQLEDNAKAADRIVKARENYKKALSENEKEIRTIKKTQRELIKQQELEKKVVDSAEGSYDQLSAQYALAKRQLNAMSKEERSATESGKALEAEAKAIRDEMKELQEATGNNALKVGDYTMVNEALSKQLSEMPGLLGNVSGGVDSLKQRFIQLLKNPIVAVLAAVSAALIGLFKAFKSTRSGSLLLENSMTTISSTMDVAKSRVRNYTAEVSENVKKQGFWKTAWQEINKAVNPAVAAMEAAEKQTEDGTKSFAEQVKTVKELSKEIIALNDAYIDIENESLIRIANLQAEADLLSIVADDDSKSMAEMIKARNRLMKVEVERAKEAEKLTQERLKVSELEIEKAIELNHLRRTDTGELISVTKEGIEIEKAYSEVKVQAIQASNEVIRVEAENAQKRRMIELDVFEQRLDLLLDVADRQKTINEQQIADDRLSLSERVDILEQTDKLIQDSFNDQMDLFEADLGVNLDRQKLMNLNNQEIVEYAEGLEMSERATNRLREVIMERRQAVNDLAVAERDLTEKTYQAQLEAFDNATELAILRAKNAEATELQITTMTIEAQIARYRKELELSKKFNKQISDTEIAIIEEKIKELQGKLDDEVEGRNFWEKLGFTEEEGSKIVGGLKDTYANIIQTLTTFADQRSELAQQNVDAANKEVESAENALDRQIELAELGYANNIQDAQRNLQLAQQTQTQAQEEQQKALQAKQRLETVEQGVSLITASANIIKTFSAIPIIGWALGIAAVGSMLAAFTASKVRAKKAAQFSEGGYEEIEGGTHASGNDTIFGYANHTELRAEKGESIGIFNARARKKYGRMLPDMVEDANKLRLEEKYTKAFDLDLLPIHTNKENFDSQDLKDIKKILSRMERQGRENTSTDKSGRRIEKRGNITKIIS